MSLQEGVNIWFRNGSIVRFGLPFSNNVMGSIIVLGTSEIISDNTVPRDQGPHLLTCINPDPNMD